MEGDSWCTTNYLLLIYSFMVVDRADSCLFLFIDVYTQTHRVPPIHLQPRLFGELNFPHLFGSITMGYLSHTHVFYLRSENKDKSSELQALEICALCAV